MRSYWPSLVTRISSTGSISLERATASFTVVGYGRNPPRDVQNFLNFCCAKPSCSGHAHSRTCPPTIFPSSYWQHSDGTAPPFFSQRKNSDDVTRFHSGGFAGPSAAERDARVSCSTSRGNTGNGVRHSLHTRADTAFSASHAAQIFTCTFSATSLPVLLGFTLLMGPKRSTLPP